MRRAREVRYGSGLPELQPKWAKNIADQIMADELEYRSSRHLYASLNNRNA
jgi:hypothetical protein